MRLWVQWWFLGVFALAAVTLTSVSGQQPTNPGTEKAAAAKEKQAKTPAGAQPKDTAKEPAKAPAKTTRKAGLRARGGAAPPKNQTHFGPSDPLAKVPAGQPEPEWPFYYKFRLTGADGVSLAASFYPARVRDNAPVLVMVHSTSTGSSSKDFQEPIEGQKDQASLALYFQNLDYAVLLVDLRGHGGSGLRRQVTKIDWNTLASDLRTAYLFLVDRHNRGELNLAKLGVVSVSESTALAVNWLNSTVTGPISGQGRASDASALVLVSPVLETEGLRTIPALSAIAPRIPILLISGERDADSVKQLQPIVERHPSSKLAPEETKLQGTRLIRFEPKVADTMARFFAEPVKFRANTDWEPRYLLAPVAVSDVVITQMKKPDAAEKKEKEPGSEEEAKSEPAKKNEVEKATQEQMKQQDKK